MAISERPDNYGRWATDGAADIVEPNEGRKDTGYINGDIAAEGEDNWLGNKAYEWERYLDERSMGYEYAGRTVSWMESTIGYADGSRTNRPLTGGVVWLAGRRLELDSVFLAAAGENTHTFTANSDTYVGINNDREIQYQTVDNDDPAPTPGAGYTHILMVVTNGTNVTDSIAQLPNVATFGVNVQFLGSVTIGNGETLGPGLPLVNFNKGTEDVGVIQFSHGDDAAWMLEFTEDEHLQIRRIGDEGPLGYVFAVNYDDGVVVFGDEPAASSAAEDNTVCVFGATTRATSRIAIMGEDATIDFITPGEGLGARLRYTDFQATLALEETTLTLYDGLYVEEISGLSGGPIVHLTRIELRTHAGQAGGAYDESSNVQWGTFVTETNTNGTEDNTVFTSAFFEDMRAFVLTADIIGVVDIDGSSVYCRTIKLVLRRNAASLVESASLIDESGESAGWSADATADLVVSANAVLLRVVAVNTTQRNWSVAWRLQKMAFSLD